MVAILCFLFLNFTCTTPFSKHTRFPRKHSRPLTMKGPLSASTSAQGDRSLSFFDNAIVALALRSVTFLPSTFSVILTLAFTVTTAFFLTILAFALARL